MRPLYSGLIALFALGLASPALAQAPVDGIYEDFPSILMQPVGPALDAPPSDRPFVEVATEDGATTVTFGPDRRVVWRITWGPHGPAEKVTLVDGEEWTRSQFAYDADGHLATKTVTGPGVPSTLVYAYRTDSAGRVLERTATLTRALGVPLVERISVTRTASETTIVTHHDGVEVRRDVRDAAGLLRETTIRQARREVARLRYRRVRGVLRVERRIGSLHGRADAGHPDPSLGEDHVRRIAGLVVDRHEAALLLGAPTRSTDEGTGVHREMHDDWSGPSCWINSTSGIEYDASGLPRVAAAACICGVCVDAALATEIDEGETLLATDLHWTRGPWVRLEGRVDVTADHEVMTPDGPVRAGELAVGDEVLAADGSAFALTSVERLPEELRLGRNLRTTDGTFAAGGILFASEEPRTCER